ncbi:MAG: hypothetical protein PHW00_03455 [Clostridia bacterium]|nr:hypothetical protein [Clostridia bacterium]
MRQYNQFYNNADTILLLCYLCMGVMLLINIMSNIYVKDNRAIKQASNHLFCQYISLTNVGNVLPPYYRVCYRLWLTLKNSKAESIILFSSRKQPVRCLLMPTLSILCALWSVVTEFLWYGCGSLFCPTLLCICCFIYILLIIKQVYAIKQRNAHRLVRRFAGYLDLLYGDNMEMRDNTEPIDNNITDSTCMEQGDQVTNKLNFLISKGVPLDSAQKIAKYITPSQLNAPRSIKAQQQLNQALNGLIKVICVAGKQS